MKTTPTTTYPCDECDWRKGQTVSPFSIRMHKIRMHSGRGWNTTQNLQRKRRHGKGNPSMEPRLVRRREYQRKLRERYYAEGRNSKGEKMPAGWKPSENRRAAALARSTAPSRTPEYQRAYARRHYKKMKALRNGAAAVVAAPTQSDQLGDAAKAVLLAAKVLRGTLTALRLP